MSLPKTKGPPATRALRVLQEPITKKFYVQMGKNKIYLRVPQGVPLEQVQKSIISVGRNPPLRGRYRGFSAPRPGTDRQTPSQLRLAAENAARARAGPLVNISLPPGYGWPPITYGTTPGAFPGAAPGVRLPPGAGPAGGVPAGGVPGAPGAPLAPGAPPPPPLGGPAGLAPPPPPPPLAPPLGGPTGAPPLAPPLGGPAGLAPGVPVGPPPLPSSAPPPVGAPPKQLQPGEAVSKLQQLFNFEEIKSEAKKLGIPTAKPFSFKKGIQSRSRAEIERDIVQRFPELKEGSLLTKAQVKLADRPAATQRIKDFFAASVGKGRGVRGQGTTDLELNELFEKYPAYQDAISIDEVDTLEPKKEIATIINLSPSHKPGTHWVALYIDARPQGSGSIEYYDSFGEDPPAELQRQLKKLIDRINPSMLLKFKINRVIDQHAKSDACGIHSALFLMDRMKGIPFKEVTGFNQKKAEGRAEKFRRKFLLV